MAQTDITIEVVTRFENNFNKHDPDLLMHDMTDDAVFEHVAAKGQGIGRFEGRDAVRESFAALPEHFPNIQIEMTDIIANGDRCSVQWIARWDLPDGGRGELKGADFFRMRGDKIAEKLSYMTLG